VRADCTDWLASVKKRHDGERTAQTEGDGVITGLFHLWRGLLVGLFKR
jgi:hypothetical protein